METKFNKSAESYLKVIASQMQSHEETQQLRIPDAMPDIQRIISCCGQVVVRSKQWLHDRIQIAGGVKTWVLYYGEEDAVPQTVEAWLPFQIECDIPRQDNDGVITVRSHLRNVDARALSDRKLMIRANVSVHAEIMVYDTLQVYHCADISNDVQVLRKVYPLRLAVDAGEKMINIEETLNLPDVNSKVLRCNVTPLVEDNKIISDKLVVRGNLQLDMLLMTSEEKILKYETEIPFSQFVQLSSENDSHLPAEIVFAITELELEKDDSGSTVLKCSFIAQYVVRDTKDVEITEDVYSIENILLPTVEQLVVPSLLNENTQDLQAICEIECSQYQIRDVNVTLDDLTVSVEADKVHFKPCGAFHVLSEDAEGKLQCNTYRWETETIPVNTTDAEIAAFVELVGVAKTMGTGVSQQLRLTIKTISNSPIIMVSDWVVGEEKHLDPDRPSLILAPMNTIDLWTLAKNTGSTVESIVKANHLNGEPDPEQILLIPIR